jgi:CTP:phosphocholine cytidylyltransferase-like protein
VLYYYTDDARCEYFSFVQGMYPEEFAPACNRDKQFEKVFLGPLNNIIGPIGIDPIKSDMISLDPLF